MVRRANGPVYILDTSAWIECNQRAGDNRIPGLLDKLFDGRRICSPKEVFAELERPGQLSLWIDGKRAKLNEPTGLPPEYAANIGMVAMKYPGMSPPLSTRRRADPFVVALALTYDSPVQRWIVVSGESRKRRPRRKIPGVCKELGLDCITLDDLIDRELPGERYTEDDFEPIG
jgi:hypothetical protein